MSSKAMPITLLYFAAIVLSYLYFPALPPLPTLTDRLVFTLQCHILTVGAVFNAFNVSPCAWFVIK